MKPSINCNRGFTIVEMLIAMVLSLIVIGMVYSMYVSLQTFYANEKRLLARQQNSRSALFFLTRDLRMAGFGGAGGSVIFFDSGIGTSRSLNMTHLISGGASDAVVVFSGDSSVSTRLSADLPNSSADLRVESVAGFTEGDHLLITDGSKSSLLEVTGINSLINELEHSDGIGINPYAGINIFPSTFAKGSMVYRFRFVKFVVKDESLHYEKGSIYNSNLLTGSEPGANANVVASNIQSLQFQYVFSNLTEANIFDDTDTDTDNDYDDIRYIKISMTAVAQDIKRNLLTQNQTKVTRIRNLGL